MPTTEDLIAQANEVAEKNKTLAAENTALKAQLMTKPSFDGTVIDSQGRERGRWDNGDDDDHSETFRAYEDPRRQSRPVTKAYRTARQGLRGLLKNGFEPGRQWKSLNEFVRDGLDNHKTSNFQERHRNHFGPTLKTIQGMSETIGSDGGFTVMPEFTPKIFERVYDNDLVSQCDQYTVTGNNMIFWANAETSRVNGSRHGGLQGYWTGEGQTITASKPTLREINIKLQKLCVVAYLTDELIKDSGTALETYLARIVADEFNFVIGNGIFNGDGVGKPLGVLNAPSLIAISKETGQLAKTVVTKNVVKAHARFFAPFRKNAKWFHNQDVEQQLPLMTIGVGTGGTTTYLPPGGLSEAPYGMLQGRPLAPIEFAQTLGTQGDLTFADLGQILAISKGGIQQAVSMHVEFLTDQLALRFTMRYNATPWENAPTTPFNGTNTQSSFVTIATRA